MPPANKLIVLVSMFLLVTLAIAQGTKSDVDCHFSIAANFEQTIDVTKCTNGTVFWSYPFGAPAYLVVDSTNAPSDHIYRVKLSLFQNTPSDSVTIYEGTDPRTTKDPLVITYVSGSKNAQSSIAADITAFTKQEKLYIKFKGPEQVGKYGTNVYYSIAKVQA